MARNEKIDEIRLGSPLAGELSPPKAVTEGVAQKYPLRHG